jgi:NhaP-type Na+/H+ or K+/H+ antiporter
LGSCKYYLTQTFSASEAMAFGSLISATDPVSVLAIFKMLNADVNLYAIVFGESIFNDAISMVMYETVFKVHRQSADSFSLISSIMSGSS